MPKLLIHVTSPKPQSIHLCGFFFKKSNWLCFRTPFSGFKPPWFPPRNSSGFASKTQSVVDHFPGLLQNPIFLDPHCSHHHQKLKSCLVCISTAFSSPFSFPSVCSSRKLDNSWVGLNDATEWRFCGFS